MFYGENFHQYFTLCSYPPERLQKLPLLHQILHDPPHRLRPLILHQHHIFAPEVGPVQAGAAAPVFPADVLDVVVGDERGDVLRSVGQTNNHIERPLSGFFPAAVAVDGRGVDVLDLQSIRF